MLTEKHGITTTEVEYKPKAFNPPKFTLPVYFGTAPVNLSKRSAPPVNVPIVVENWGQAVDAFGFSDDWENFSLCEAMFAHLNLMKQGPICLVNVLDPKKHNAKVEPTVQSMTNRMITMDVEGILLESLVVSSEDGATPYTLGTDYTATFNLSGRVVIAAKKGGAIPENVTSLQVGYDRLDTSKVTEADIIGGTDAETGERSGLELVEEVFPRFQYVPGLVLAPGHSSNPTVAAVMFAKSQSINGNFEAEAVVDLDAAKRFMEIVQWKNDHFYSDPLAITGWPKVTYKGRAYHASTMISCGIFKVDADNDGIPFESPSNKPVPVDGMILSNGSEILVPKDQADYLNANGIVTFINFTGHYTTWGNRTAAYPIHTDPQRAFIPVRRMFGWTKNMIAISLWAKVDRPGNKRLIGEVLDDANIWINGLVGAGALLGGRVEFNASENPEEDLMNGKYVFNVYLSPPTPGQELHFRFEYDASYLSVLTAA